MKWTYVALGALALGALVLLFSRSDSAGYITVAPGEPVEGCGNVEYLQVVNQ
jgi:hypothetical protein